VPVLKDCVARREVKALIPSARVLTQSNCHPISSARTSAMPFSYFSSPERRGGHFLIFFRRVSISDIEDFRSLRYGQTCDSQPPNKACNRQAMCLRGWNNSLELSIDDIVLLCQGFSQLDLVIVQEICVWHDHERNAHSEDIEYGS